MGRIGEGPDLVEDVVESDFRRTSTMESQHHGTTAEGRTSFVDRHHLLSERGDSTLTACDISRVP